MASGFLGVTVMGALLLGCSNDEGAMTEAARTAEPVNEAPAKPAAGAGAAAGSRASILSAYYGLDELPPRVVRLCNLRSVRQNGVPVTFSVRLKADTLSTEDFAVETATGDKVTPVCATLAPADEPLEARTVLLAGKFGTPEAPLRAVEVVGDLEAADGTSVKGLRTTDITPLAAGPSLVLAERFAPDTPGLAGECPAATKQVVQLTWQGGVTGPDNSELGEPQRQAVSVTLEDGSTVTPVGLADDDPDNFVHACLDADSPAQSVTVAAGHFHDPGDDANPATKVEVVTGVP